MLICNEYNLQLFPAKSCIVGYTTKFPKSCKFDLSPTSHGNGTLKKPRAKFHTANYFHFNIELLSEKALYRSAMRCLFNCILFYQSA